MGLRIGQVAEAVGCTLWWLRRAEKSGIIPPSVRTEFGNREWQPDQLEEIRAGLIARRKEIADRWSEQSKRMLERRREKDAERKRQMTDDEIAVEDRATPEEFVEHVAAVFGAEAVAEILPTISEHAKFFRLDVCSGCGGSLTDAPRKFLANCGRTVIDCDSCEASYCDGDACLAAHIARHGGQP